MSFRKHYIEAHNDVLCKLAPSPIHGVGVFAIKDIPADTVIFRSDTAYDEVDIKILNRIPKEVAELYSSLFIYDDESIWIPKNGVNSVDISFYINHSVEPNLKYDLENDLFVSKISISKNTELTFDYRSLGINTVGNNGIF